MLSSNVKEQFTNFGASGTLLYALVTSVLLAWMLGRLDLRARRL